MNTNVPIPPPEQHVWAVAAEQVDRWRGSAMGWFARTEFAVSKTLLYLSQDPPTDQFVGTRFRLLAADLANRPTASRAQSALEAFMPLLERRVALCHGEAQIAREQNGAWLVRLKWHDFAKQGLPREMTWDEAEAAMFLADLRRRSRALIHALDRIREPAIPAPAST